VLTHMCAYNIITIMCFSDFRYIQGIYFVGEGDFYVKVKT
jgi:hypothetical protein